MDTPQVELYPPPFIVERINALGGMNPFGQPNFRVIWGGNRYHLVGGAFKKPLYIKTGIIGEPDRAVVTTVNEMRSLPKYHISRWHLERWRGPEWYGSPEQWYQETFDPESNMMTQGPFPTLGDYEHVFYLAQCTHLRPTGEWCNLCIIGCGQFIPLEENFYMLERQIKMLQMSEDVNAKEERSALFMREEKKRQVYRNIVGERVRGAMRPTLATQSTSWQDGSRCSIPESNMAKQWDKNVSLPGSTGIRQSDDLLIRNEES